MRELLADTKAPEVTKTRTFAGKKLLNAFPLRFITISETSIVATDFIRFGINPDWLRRFVIACRETFELCCNCAVGSGPSAQRRETILSRIGLPTRQTRGSLFMTGELRVHLIHASITDMSTGNCPKCGSYDIYRSDAAPKYS